MVRSTCWLYSTLITNTTITITYITTKYSKCWGLPAWTQFGSNWHCTNYSVYKTHFHAQACVFITCVYVLNMSNCEPQDPPIVNYGNQVLQAAGKWSPVPPQAQSRVHVSSLDFWHSCLVWSRSCEVLYIEIYAQPPYLVNGQLSGLSPWAFWLHHLALLNAQKQQWLKQLAISSPVAK